MYGYRCLRCENYWATHAAPEVGYGIITRLCPDCIVRALPTIDHIPVPPPMRHDLTSPWVPGTTTAGVS